MNNRPPKDYAEMMSQYISVRLYCKEFECYQSEHFDTESQMQARADELLNQGFQLWSDMKGTKILNKQISKL